jgi:glycosyltransferase involved in cell wall biosynthesis
LAQTFTDFELIISDNASTDSTEDICRQYAEKDDRLRYVRQVKNLGSVANFKFVLDEAVGDYFMWAAADDKRHIDFIEMAMRVFSENKNVGLVFSAMETVNLQNGDSNYSITGFINTNRKFFRVLFRLSHLCPSLIYGLYHTQVLRKIELKNYDYLDLYLSFWFELNSNIRVIPLNLYSAGTNGIRIPYGLNTKYINSEMFIKEMSKLIKQHFSILTSFILIIFIRYFIAKATKSHNLLIRSK